MNNWIRLRTLLVVLLFVLPVVLTQQSGLAQNPDPEGKTAAAGIRPAAPVTLSRAFSGGPAYDSGWITLAKGESRTLNHRINGVVSTYVVDMQYRSSEDGINQRYYSGVDFGIVPPANHADSDRVGAYWRSLEANTIVVYRRPEDTYAAQVRIRIWVDNCPSPACWDSGWQSMAQNETRTLTHNMGDSVDDYVVDMQFKNVTSGINQRYYGGADFGDMVETGSPEDRVGAYWYGLTNTVIITNRRPEDTYAEQVRVRIWKRPEPTYDSGWVTINKNQAIPLFHGISGQPDDYLVNMEFQAADTNGINNRAYGGMDIGSHPSAGQAANDQIGAYWHSLTPTAIIIYRRPQDNYAPKIRIRIFRFWGVQLPNYDSGWQPVAQDVSLILAHNMGGVVNDYMVDLSYRNSEDGVNHRYYGGADFGASPFPGQAANDRVGAYWHRLSTTSITVYRQPEDTCAEQVRVRIWRMPKPDYNSGWLTRTPGDTPNVLTHNLGGSYQEDYLVYFDQYNSDDKTNQRYYGGIDFGSKSFGGYANNQRAGAFWHQLNDTTVSVTRRQDDTYADQFRLRIWRIRRPDFNSDWVTLNQDEAAGLLHNLGGSVDFYFMQMVQWDGDSTNSLNQRHYGGADFGNLPPTTYHENDRVGAYWHSLNTDSITVYRRPEDGYADFVQVRIWDYHQELYLPAILK